MPIPETPQNLHRSLLRDDAYVTLRNDIISGRLRPGERLQAESIATVLGFSRTPVHEALGKLAVDGFVDVRPQKGTRVAVPSRASVADVLLVYRHMALALLPEPTLTAVSASVVVDEGIEEPDVGILDVCRLFDVVIDGSANQTLRRTGDAIIVHVRWALTVFPDLAPMFAMPSRSYAALENAFAARDRGVAEAATRRWSEALVRIVEHADGASHAEGRSRTLLRDQVQASILGALADGTLRSGERLRDEQLMRWLGVSRTPVREALCKLEMIGVIETLPARQTVVAPLNGDRLGEVLCALAVFADLTMRLGVPRLAPRARESVLQDYQDMQQAAETGRFGGAVTSFVSAQLRVAVGTRSKTLKSIVESVTPWLYKGTEIEWAVNLTIVREHAMTMQTAVSRGDEYRAARETRRLLQEAAAAVSSRRSAVG